MSTELQLELTNCQRPAGFAPATGSAWVESWHNSKLRFCDVPPEHQVAWLNETAKWLLKGRRWPMSPTDRQIKHCIYWWPRVVKLMMAHGWWPECAENDLTGYTVTWRFGDDMRVEYELAQGACQAHYAGITGAAICRRKARYYGLWNTQNAEVSGPAAENQKP